MTTDQPAPDGDPAALPSQPRPGFAERARLAARVVQVRLRFVVVIVAAFLVVGLWGNLRNVWETWAHRLAGSQHAHGAISADTEYFCPMDPGVVSDWPAICPVCSMDLIRRKKGEAVILPEGVVARMQFSPYRVQLAGIKTAVVASRPMVREFIVAGRIVDQATGTRDAAPPLKNLALECDVFPGDLERLTPGRRAEISIQQLPGSAPLAGMVADRQANDSRAGLVRIRFDAPPPQLHPGMYGTARVPVPLGEFEPFASRPAISDAQPGEFPGVPETAVVATGSRRLVFVETMPGMFDGVEVTLGPRCGDYYPVLSGVAPGQRVAAVGAFLIDAEARLSPNLAAGYFGAARTAETTGESSAPPAVAATKPAGKKTRGASKLSAADQQLVDQQKTCPVTDLPLDSMGGPVAVDVAGRRVFICCKGCEGKLKQEPEKYLAKLKK
jgi:Heavy metal binding domain